MKNPLMKRLPRELIGDIGKYLVIFLFMIATIGFVSGFLVADNSMLAAYNESFEKYNIEDGNFTLCQKASDTQLQHLVDAGVKIYENFLWKRSAGSREMRQSQRRAIRKRVLASCAFTDHATKSISCA